VDRELETVGESKAVFCRMVLSMFSIERNCVDVARCQNAPLSALSSEVKSFNSIPFSN
jgi:hypothetical protein